VYLIESIITKWLHSDAYAFKELHRVWERARHVEKVLRVVWESVTPWHSRAVQEFRPVLVASGGLARGEIYPKSDADVRVIYSGSITGSDRLAILARLLDGLRCKLRGFKWLACPALIGIEEALRLARLESEFFSALLEARVIAGNIDTFLAFEDKFWSQCVKEIRDKYLWTRIENRRVRIKSLDTVTPILGVNIKRGIGGMLDFWDLLWSNYVMFGSWDIGLLADKKLLTGDELKWLLRAYIFLVRVREHLHRFALPERDSIESSIVEDLATALGYKGPQKAAQFNHDLRGIMSGIARITLKVQLMLVKKDFSTRGCVF